MKVAVLLSGCGVYDGAEIHESVLTLLALKQKNLEIICVAPDQKQHHVINHSNGEELKEERNVFTESSRIARGEIIKLGDLDYKEINSLVMPGGFGAAKNLSSWAFKSADCDILPEVKNLIIHCIENKKPIVSLCISPVLIAKSLEGTKYQPQLTLGSTQKKSPYEIKEMHQGLESLGVSTKECSADEISIDEELKIITAPCYMMEIGIDQLHNNIQSAIEKLSSYLN